MLNSQYRKSTSSTQEIKCPADIVRMCIPYVQERIYELKESIDPWVVLYQPEIQERTDRLKESKDFWTFLYKPKIDEIYQEITGKKPTNNPFLTHSALPERFTSVDETQQTETLQEKNPQTKTVTIGDKPVGEPIYREVVANPQTQ